MSADRDWLNGPALAAWLKEMGLHNEQAQLGNKARLIRQWRNGGTASVYAALDVMTRLELYEWEIPESLWSEPPADKRAGRKSTRLPEEVRQEIFRQIRRGDPRPAIAQRLGVNRETVRRYERKVAA